MGYQEQIAPALAYNQGRADGARAAQPAAGGFNPANFAGGGTALLNMRLTEESTTLKEQVLELKQRLHACRAVRDTLKHALQAVAPDHPLINPFSGNPLLGAVGTEAAKKVTDETQI